MQCTVFCSTNRPQTDDRTALLATIRNPASAPVGKPTHLNSQLCASAYSRWQRRKSGIRGTGGEGESTKNFIIFAFGRLVTGPSSTEGLVWSQTKGGHRYTGGSYSSSTAISSCQYPSTNPPYLYFINLLLTLHNFCHWQRRNKPPVHSLPICISTNTDSVSCLCTDAAEIPTEPTRQHNSVNANP